MAATKREDKRKNNQYIFSKELSKYTRLKWRIKSTIIK